MASATAPGDVTRLLRAWQDGSSEAGGELWRLLYEELRGLVASWRMLHRWLAVAMVLLAANHIAIGFRYGRLW